MTGNPMSLVFQNIDPPPPLSARRVCPPPNKGGGYTIAERRGGRRGSIFWKTKDIGLPSYSNNLSTMTGNACRDRRSLAA